MRHGSRPDERRGGALSQESGQPDGPPEVTVVVPALDAARTIGAQLDALLHQRTSLRFEVVVADNGSTDGTAELVRQRAGGSPVVRLVDASARRSQNTARNAGVAAARADRVLLCDADDVVDEDWLEVMATALETASLVGGRLERLRLNEEYVRRWGRPAGIGGITDVMGFLPFPSGACCGFRRTVWEQLGGFDERYAGGGDETEFFWRAQLAGHRLEDVPRAIVHYRMRSTPREMWRQSYRWGRQAAMLYRDFRPHGMPHSVRRAAREWAWTVKLGVQSVGGGPASDEALRQLAYRCGRLAGCVRFRVVYP